jgi:YidC/Oxa1 family membrane protein insertase
MSWFDTLLWPLMVAVAWIMTTLHRVLTWLGLESGSGVTWMLSIVGLVLIMRTLLIPLFVRQIRAARGMQMLSPELQALQKKYKGRSDPASREAMSRETMELYRKHGTNPLSSCMPILAQSPIFFALFRVLNSLGDVADGTFSRDSIGTLTRRLAQEAESATIFEAPISARFMAADATTSIKVVAVVLILLMSVTTFTTQKQLTQKNMPASALQGPMAQQQKMLMYLMPVVFALSGVNFPIGVLIYWSTTNLWTMGQQFYVIRRNPTPGSEAERRLKERRREKAAKRGIVLPEEVVEPEKSKGQRQQPVRKDRARTRPPGAAGAAGAAGGSGAKEGKGGGSGKSGSAGGAAGVKRSSGAGESGGSSKSRSGGGAAGVKAGGAAGVKRSSGAGGSGGSAKSGPGGAGDAVDRPAGAKGAGTGATDRSAGEPGRAKDAAAGGKRRLGGTGGSAAAGGARKSSGSSGSGDPGRLSGKGSGSSSSRPKIGQEAVRQAEDNAADVEVDASTSEGENGK